MFVDDSEDIEFTLSLFAAKRPVSQRIAGSKSQKIEALQSHFLGSRDASKRQMLHPCNVKHNNPTQKFRLGKKIHIDKEFPPADKHQTPSSPNPQTSTFAAPFCSIRCKVRSVYNKLHNGQTNNFQGQKR